MFNEPQANQFEGWIHVYQTGSDVDAAMVRSFLEDRSIEVQVLSKRDSAYSLNVGDMAQIYLYVPSNREEEALEALKEWQSGEIELDEDNENENP